ncbi:MAG: porin [Pseudomonadota bacterium]
MKKQLLCTSAIALGVAAAPVAAQDWNVDWGGFANMHVAFADIGGSAVPAGVDLDGLFIHQNAEIIFTPSVTLDNGLTFGYQVQFEALNSGTTNPRNNSLIDESYVTISGDSLGTLDIGYENSAGYKMSAGAPSVSSMFINSPSISAFIPFSATVPGLFRNAVISSFTEVSGNNDVARITYYTPSFNGLTLGVSYAPTGAVNAANNFVVDRNVVLSDIFDVGVAYSGSFGTTDVYLSARYGTGDDPAGSSDPDTWAIGANVTFGGITVGGSYAENNDTGVGDLDTNGYSFGVSYDAPGPWSFSGELYIGEVEGQAGGVFGAFGDHDYEAYQVAASRDIGPGVDWDIYLVYLEADNGGAPFPGLAAGKVDGTAIGTAINLSF